ncbi:globin-like protein [Xylariaceae sp. FL0804]|nr:globin-like protein [Xylariaceae sp. FL0804]
MAAAPLTPDQIAIVKATAPVLKEHGTAITSLFYRNMLDAHPELHNMFNSANQVNGAQPRALAGAVFAYASYVDDLGRLGALVERIAHKHVSLTVTADQYPIVGRHLLGAVAAVLGDACTPAVAAAWTAAYAALADVFVGRERQIYAGLGVSGWTGWRRFRVRRKVRESSEITSFHLAPEEQDDEGQTTPQLPAFLPGQYVSLRVMVPALGYLQPRQYSLSEAPHPDYYRISVKREKGDAAAAVPGVVSNLLHDSYGEGDVVELTHPTGEFFARSDDDDAGSGGGKGAPAPFVLLSAGVGITPMISILNSAVAAGSSRPIHFVHGAHSSEARAFGDHIREASARPNVTSTVFLTTVQAHEVEGVDYQFRGRMDLNKVGSEALSIGHPGTQYFVCGPTSFMDDIRQHLLSKGVDDDRVHRETFGVGDSG